MKKIILFLLTGIFCYSQNIPQHRTCGTPQKMQELISANPSFAKHHHETMDYIRTRKSNREVSNTTTVITIPVVVHVLYKTTQQNISDAQVLSQINILNQDYTKTNIDFSTVVPVAFQSYGANCELAFCMATQKPDGTATNGIERKSVPSSFVFEEDYYTSSGLTAWDPTKYLNIWVGKFTDTSLLGFAYLPSAAGMEFDGLCIGYKYYGDTGAATAPFNKGRTATHEIGHYFGLDHPWGDDGNCNGSSGDDGVTDTPRTNNPYFECPTFPDNTNTCTTSTNGAMFMNYMDYVDDACMAFFTSGQKQIMQATMSGPRASLLTSNGCSTLNLDQIEAIRAISVYPNPVSEYFMITSPHTDIDLVEVFDMSGKLVKTQKLQNINNVINIEQFNSGTYFLRIYNQGTLLKSEKVLKQ